MTNWKKNIKKSIFIKVIFTSFYSQELLYKESITSNLIIDLDSHSKNPETILNHVRNSA